MADTITLKRKIKNEYAPRYYSMAGGTFDEMLQAVKDLDQRRFETYPHKAWKINGDGLAALTEAGYDIEEWPALRLTQFVEGSMRDHGDKLSVTAYFEYMTEDGDYRRGPRKNLVIQIDDETVEARQALITERDREAFPDLELTPASRYQAVRNLAREAVKECGTEIVERFHEARGNDRTQAGMQAGFDAIKEAL